VPRLSVWLVRASLAYFGVGITLGAVLLAGRELADGPWVAQLRPLHAELLLYGWTLQLIMGVAYWILPRFPTGAERGHPLLPWAACGLLNLGVLVAALGTMPAAAPRAAAILLGRGLETLAVAAFIAHALPRIKGFGRQVSP
jgi:cbb3-type cytochrome oxidase subunit 1